MRRQAPNVGTITPSSSKVIQVPHVFCVIVLEDTRVDSLCIGTVSSAQAIFPGLVGFTDLSSGERRHSWRTSLSSRFATGLEEEQASETVVVLVHEVGHP
jgi:hypothetical protein